MDMDIDASIWEGGGQIFRNSISLSVILKKSLRIHSIRCNRPNPGLHNQALAVIRVIQEIFGGECENAKLGSTEVNFIPDSECRKKTGHANDNQYIVDVGSAGSITLVLQSLLPCITLCGRGLGFDIINLTVTGGTNVSFSPPLEHFVSVLTPLLSLMGIHVETRLLKRGLYPRGGGEVQLRCSTSPGSDILPIVMISQGVIENAHIYVYVCVDDPLAIEGTDTERILEHTENAITSGLSSVVSDLLSATDNVMENISIQFESLSTTLTPGLNSPKGQFKREASCDSTYSKHLTQKSKEKEYHNNFIRTNNQSHKRKKIGGKMKSSVTIGALVSFHTSNGCVLSADAMVSEKNHNRFDEEKSWAMTNEIVDTIKCRLERVVRSGACIDEHTSDQLLLYMALAQGQSEILCAPFCEADHSQHINAAIDVISQFTQRKFSVEVDPATKCRLIRCESL